MAILNRANPTLLHQGEDEALTMTTQLVGTQEMEAGMGPPTGDPKDTANPSRNPTSLLLTATIINLDQRGTETMTMILNRLRLVAPIPRESQTVAVETILPTTTSHLAPSSPQSRRQTLRSGPRISL
ncbi:hypothetical protein PHISP_08590 [Aspergillus sp. HF37]|nr:hypothetical protein PHISP_08590 [Aspergillus sp. HF37]